MIPEKHRIGEDHLTPKPKFKSRLYERIAYFVPQKQKNRIKEMLVFAGIDQKLTDKFTGFLISFSFGIAVMASYLAWLSGFGLLSMPIGISIGILFSVIMLVMLVLIADSRAKEVEVVLPDSLQLIAANIRAGMTIDKAIWLAARPEFGVLEDEIRKVGAETLSGESIRNALGKMTTRVNSVLLRRAVKLLVEGLESGGEVAHLLEQTSINIRIMQGLRKEMHASVMMYSLFIMFAAVLGAPLLYAISLYFVSTMSVLWGSQLTTANMIFSGASFVNFSPPTITPGELFWFSIAAMLVTTFFASLLIGLIQTGKERNGVKYIIPVVLGALVVFFVARLVVSSLFGGTFAR